MTVKGEFGLGWAWHLKDGSSLSHTGEHLGRSAMGPEMLKSDSHDFCFRTQTLQYLFPLLSRGARGELIKHERGQRKRQFGPLEDLPHVMHLVTRIR